MATNKTKKIPSDYYVDENQQRTKSNTPVEENVTVINETPGSTTEVTNPAPTATSTTGENNTSQNVTGQKTPEQMLADAQALLAQKQKDVEQASSDVDTSLEAYRSGALRRNENLVREAESTGNLAVAQAQDVADLASQDVAAKQAESQQLATEGETDYDNARRAAIMTGLAEFGANLANLWGTTKGGTSAKIDRPRDWMSKAEEIRTTERAKRDARNKEIRDLIRQRQLAERQVKRTREQADIDIARARADAELATLQSALESSMEKYQKAVAEGKNVQDAYNDMQKAMNDLIRANASLTNAEASRIRAINAGKSKTKPQGDDNDSGGDSVTNSNGYDTAGDGNDVEKPYYED